VFFCLFIFCFKIRRCQGENVQNKRAEARAKSETVEWELKGKLPPFFTYIFFFVFFFSFLLLEKKKMPGENV
jgi:hypothetical protein